MLSTYPDNQQIAPIKQRYISFISAFMLYFITCVYCIYISHESGSIAAAWYANAIIVVFLQACAYRDWPIYLLIAALANAAGRFVLGDPWLMSLIFIPGNLLEIFLMAYVIRRFIALPQCHNNPLMLLKLFSIILLPIAISALVAAAVIRLYGLTSYGEAWISWVTSSLIGCISILPLGIVLLNHTWDEIVQVKQAFTILMGILLSLLFALFGFLYIPDPYIYISATLLLVAFAGRFTGTAVAVLVYSIIIGTLIVYGFFQPSMQGNYYANRDFYMYLPMVMTLLQPLLLAAALQRIYDKRA